MDAKHGHVKNGQPKTKTIREKNTAKMFGPVRERDGTHRILVNFETDKFRNYADIVKFIKSRRLR